MPPTHIAPSLKRPMFSTFEEVHALVASLDGSISAEHGLGTMKTAEALAYKSPVEVAAMRAIRQALDPLRIMNPRVLF